MTDSIQQATAHSYDQVAAVYAAKFQNELDHKPFDRKMLELLIEKVGANETICDMGCGPGQIAAFLADRGATACGIDLSSQMVSQARQFHPQLSFEQGDMLALTQVGDGAFGGIAAFYSIIHVPLAQQVAALRELYRVLHTGGCLLVTFHIGDETRHLDTWFDQAVNVDFHFFQPHTVTESLQAAGFALEERIEREPYSQEVQTRRAYLFARKQP